MSNYKCPWDKVELEQVSGKKVKVKKHTERYAVYKCPICKRQFVHIVFLKSNTSYLFPGCGICINLLGTGKELLEEKKHHSIVGSEMTQKLMLSGLKEINKKNAKSKIKKCYVYGSGKIESCKKCGNKDLQLRKIPHLNNSKVHYNVRECQNCNLYYIAYGVYKKHSEEWTVINPQDLNSYQEVAAEKNNSSIVESNPSKLKKKVSKGPHIITAHDFVVRRTIFKCKHNNHQIEDVKAVFTTISRQGTVNKITIPAGYCATCNMYFIMESTYKRIKYSGIPICRTMDEKSYENNNSTGLYNNNLASESVLMQFGYNVSQKDDLPAEQRRRILAAIVDNDVLKRNEVVSYLDYFISQRKNQKNKDGSLRYKDAMDKCRMDRAWINKYKLGSYKEVLIRSIVDG